MPLTDAYICLSARYGKTSGKKSRGKPGPIVIWWSSKRFSVATGGWGACTCQLLALRRGKGLFGARCLHWRRVPLEGYRALRRGHVIQLAVIEFEDADDLRQAAGLLLQRACLLYT